MHPGDDKIITPSPDELVNRGSGWLGIGVMGWGPSLGLNPRKEDASPNNEPPEGTPALRTE